MLKKITVKLNILLILIFMISLTGCGSEGSSWNGYSRQSFYFDTICEIRIYGLEEVPEGGEEAFNAACGDIITGAFGLLSDMERTLSRTVEGSDTDRINKAAGKPVKVKEETLEVIRKGIEFGDVSHGAFDITVGKASELWDFHEDPDETAASELPSADALGEASEHIDYRKIKINEDSLEVQLEDPEMILDLGGIAKGYIADVTAEYLRSRGVTSAIVNLGGNIEAVGGKPASYESGNDEQSDFSLGIRDPGDESGGLLGLYPGRDVTIVTSGTYERFIEVDGKRYHHILDPDTGYPVDTDVVQVSIIADKGHSVDCDGLSTACLALGTEKGTELIKELDSSGIYGNIEAIFVKDDGEILFTREDTAFVKE